MKKAFLLAVAALTLIAAPAAAKEGFYIGAYVTPSAKVSGTGMDSGSGYGFRAGMGFGRYLSIEGNYETSRYDVTGGTADLKGLAADLKLNFPLTSLDSNNVMTLEPYAKAGYAISYDLKIPNAGTSSGSGARIGFGIELYVFKELSINAGWTRTKISFDDPINKDANIRAYDIGLIYHFI